MNDETTIIDWQNPMFMSGRGVKLASFDGHYRGWPVVCGVSGKLRCYALMSVKSRTKHLAKFDTEQHLVDFIDKMMVSRADVVTFAEVQRLRALCEHHNINPDWPLSVEMDDKVRQLLQHSPAETISPKSHPLPPPSE